MSSTTTANLTQYGFFFDQSRCIGCRACSIACKDWNNIDVGPVKWMRVFETESGTFPSVSENILVVPCFHCQNPVCVAKAAGAMFKEAKYGAVLIDPELANSSALRDAANACPYGAIVFDSDSSTANASKCTMCIDRLEQNKLPACVESCPLRALDFGPLATLQSTYGKVADLTGLPSSSLTQPSTVFKPIEAKKQLVSYDVPTALTLFGARGNGLPAVYSSSTAVVPTSSGVVGRSTLNLKPSSTEDLMAATRNDDA